MGAALFAQGKTSHSPHQIDLEVAPMLWLAAATSTSCARSRMG
jgi:hypothetical protein